MIVEILVATAASATAVALSPVPVISLIILLMAAHGLRLGIAFATGWLVGIGASASVFAVFAAALPTRLPDVVQQILGWVSIVIGVGALTLAWQQWRSRPGPDTRPALPVWLAQVDTMRARAALMLGFALIVVNPKNLLVAAATGAVVGRSGLPVPMQVAIVLGFTVLAGVTVLGLVLVVAVTPRSSERWLTGLRRWLTAHAAIITSVLLAALGVLVIINALTLI